MPRFFRIAVLLAVLTSAAPVIAKQSKSAAAHGAEATNMLRMRLLSADIRIDMLRDRELLGRAEAQDLRNLARDLERRLPAVSTREVAGLERAIDLLEARVGYAIDGARWSRHAYDDSEGRHVGGTPHRRGGQSDYRHFDRYTAPPVDRWHDPFDRGSGL